MTAKNKARAERLVLVLIFFMVTGWTITSFGQSDDPFSIRVESNEVLVRAQVFRKGFRYASSDSYYLACMDRNEILFASLPMSKPYVQDEDCLKQIEIGDLEAKDFSLFEDGKEQKIGHVVLEHPPWTLERDMHSTPVTSHKSTNDHVEFHRIWSYTPRGIWRSADLRKNGRFTAGFFYRISYVPQNLKPGGCHRIKIRVKNRPAEVLATDRYCYIPHLPNDALAGTDLSKSMESELGSHFVDPVIPLLVRAGFFYSQSAKTLVNVALSFPPDELKSNFNGALHGNIGVLGIAYGQNDSEIARFSDAAIVKGDLFRGSSELAALPSRYETQMDLPPGQYELRIALSDGTKFGRTVIPIHIDELDNKRPTLSSLFLFKRFRNAGVAQQESAKVNLAPAFVRLVSQEINITPTADPTFHPKELLPVYFEVYEPGAAEKSATTVEVHMQIVDVKTHEVKKSFLWFDAEPYRRSGTNTFAIHKFLYTGELGAGEYRLEAQAKDSLGQTSGWRTTDFTIK